MKTKYLISLIVIALVLIGCTNVSESDLIEFVPVEENVTYNSHIKTIIDNNCIVCHNNPPENGAPMPLITYENVKQAMENRGLIERISSNDQDFLMPFGGQRLPQNLIDLVVQWQTDGLLED